MTRQHLLRALVGLWAVFALLDLFVVPHDHDPGVVPGVTSSPFWVKIPGFFSLFGLVGCLALILGAKALGAWLQRDEGYYGD